MSKCGFPALEMTGANIDVTILKVEGKPEAEDLADNETVSSDQSVLPKQQNGKLSFNAGAGQRDDSCGKMRKIYVTLTNIPPTNTTNSTRILQAAAQNMQLTFSASAGDSATSSAKSIIYSAVFAVITFMAVLF